MSEPTIYRFVCVVCGFEGTSTYPRRLVCSKACRYARINQAAYWKGRRTSEDRQAERARIAANARKVYRTAEQRAADKAAREAAKIARRGMSRAVRRDQPPRDCLCCLTSFTPKNPNAACCSKTCRQRYESRRRKARLRGLAPVVITSAHLFNRGDTDCGLCRQPVDRTLRYPHPMSATVDHIVPLTKGGVHHIDNTQLAHARCNTVKGNRYAA